MDYLCKLGKVLNGMGTELVLCYHKLAKTPSPIGGSATAAVEAAIASKMGRMLGFLNCEYDDPSRSAIDFAREYVQVRSLKDVCDAAGNVSLRIYVFSCFVCFFFNPFSLFNLSFSLRRP